ncbi:hypothetical protein Tco_0660830 [Tanacetum coccineum]
MLMLDVVALESPRAFPFQYMCSTISGYVANLLAISQPLYSARSIMVKFALVAQRVASQDFRCYTSYVILSDLIFSSGGGNDEGSAAANSVMASLKQC